MGNYKFRNPNNGIIYDFEDFFRCRISKIEGLGEIGDANNIYTELWDGENELDVYIPEKVSYDPIDVVMTVLITGDEYVGAIKDKMIHDISSFKQFEFFDNTRNLSNIIFYVGGVHVERQSTFMDYNTDQWCLMTLKFKKSNALDTLLTSEVIPDVVPTNLMLKNEAQIYTLAELNSLTEIGSYGITIYSGDASALFGNTASMLVMPSTDDSSELSQIIFCSRGIFQRFGDSSSVSGAFKKMTVEVGSAGTIQDSAIGVGSNATYESVAIGVESISASGSVAIGLESISASGSVAVGRESVSESGSVAIGIGANSDIAAVAVGSSSAANNQSIAIGNVSIANVPNSIQLGEGENKTPNSYREYDRYQRVVARLTGGLVDSQSIKFKTEELVSGSDTAFIVKGIVIDSEGLKKVDFCTTLKSPSGHESVGDMAGLTVSSAKDVTFTAPTIGMKASLIIEMIKRA